LKSVAGKGSHDRPTAPLKNALGQGQGRVFSHPKLTSQVRGVSWGDTGAKDPTWNNSKDSGVIPPSKAASTSPLRNSSRVKGGLPRDGSSGSCRAKRKF